METVNSNNVKQIQIDVTSYCNSFCSSCLRNINGGPVNPLVKLQHMPWGIWKKIVDFCADSNVVRLYFNGNYGDLSSHPDIVEMFEYLYIKNPKTLLHIHTNGGARNPKFWSELAKVVSKFSGSYVTFSIDGLEDTNHIYRRGVDFKRIMQNASVYMSAGGMARWRMLVFDHNKHQLDEARNLAKEMGFFQFSLNHSYATELKADAYKEFPQTNITAPTADEVNKLRKEYEFITYKWKDLSVTDIKSYPKLDTKCPWAKDLKIQINQLGEVWPCCYVSFSSAMPSRYRFKYLDEKFQLYGKQFNNLNYYNLKEIIDHDFFQNDLPHSFENSLLGVCSQKCGV